MSNFTVKRIDHMEAVFGGAFKRARAELGIEAFGIQVIDMPPNVDQYPEHDHSEDGQEEVYLAIRGSAEMKIDGELHRLDPDTMVRVAPGVKRTVITGAEPLRMVVIGGCAGKPYEAPDVTRLGAPDPLAQQQS